MSVARKIRCTVAGLKPEGGRVYTVHLKPTEQLPRFKPGQFLHLTLDPYDPSGFWPESRIFSIASSPQNRTGLSIAYSVKGAYTSRMERELCVGSEVWIKLPYGEFIIGGTNDIVLCAGGTGITAFTAFIEGLTPDFPHAIHLAYGARNPELLLYRDMIARQAVAVPQFSVSYFIEQGARPTQDGPSIGEFEGILAVEAIWPFVREPRTATFYLSGPPAMLTALGNDLTQKGITRSSIRIDAWE